MLAVAQMLHANHHTLLRGIEALTFEAIVIGGENGRGYAVGDDAYNGIFAFGIVFVDSLACIAVTSYHDILDEAVYVDLEVGVPTL